MKYILAAALLAICFTASAGNNNGPDYGDVTNNTTNNYATTNQGGNATAGASAGAVSGSAAISGSSSSVGDVKAYGGAGGDSTAIAVGGEGGKGGTGYGGSAHQGQSQGQSLTSTIGATGSGNSTSVGGQSTSVSYRNERSAPPVFLGNMAPTVSCAGGFNAGASSQGGSGAFGFTWISADCKQVVAGQNMLAAGETRLACEVFRQTDGFKRAARRNPELNEIACK